MPAERTEHNRKGHKIALDLGFKALGPTIYGWRDAKVECVVCGHRLPWYHHEYQRKHREACPLPTTERAKAAPSLLWCGRSGCPDEDIDCDECAA